MTVEEAKKAVVDLAESEVGYHEKASNANLDDPSGNSGGNNWTKYARDLDAIPDYYNGKKMAMLGAMCLWIGALSTFSEKS